MAYQSNTGCVNIAFYDLDKKCFDLNHRMSMTRNKDDYDYLLKYILDSLFDQLTKDEFQELILDGELVGLTLYMYLKLVKNKSGKTIWVRR